MSPTAPDEDKPLSRKRPRSDEKPRERDRSRRDERPRDKEEERQRSGHSRREARDSRPEGDVQRRDRVDRDAWRRNRRRFRDSPPPNSDVDVVKAAAEIDEGDLAARDRSDLPPPPPQPRSRTYFQHDERSSAGNGDRNMVRKAGDEGRWSGPKKFRDDRSAGNNVPMKDEGPHPKSDDGGAWKHDGFYELEAPARKRPAFREKKLDGEEPSTGANESNPTLLPRQEKSGTADMQHDMKSHNRHGRERHERPFPGGDSRDLRRGEGGYPRYGNQYRDRDSGTLGSGGRDRFNGRRYDGRNSSNQVIGFQVEKWKHDLYEEANRSPTPKNEDDKIAKLEALLAS